MDYCECGAPLAFSPDGVHCVGCSERQASRDELEPAWSSWFVSFPNPERMKCNGISCPNVAAWVFVPGPVLVCEACYGRLCRELLRLDGVRGK